MGKYTLAHIYNILHVQRVTILAKSLFICFFQYFTLVQCQDLIALRRNLKTFSYFFFNQSVLFFMRYRYFLGRQEALYSDAEIPRATAIQLLEKRVQFDPEDHQRQEGVQSPEPNLLFYPQNHHMPFITQHRSWDQPQDKFSEVHKYLATNISRKVILSITLPLLSSYGPWLPRKLPNVVRWAGGGGRHNRVLYFNATKISYS